MKLNKTIYPLSDSFFSSSLHTWTISCSSWNKGQLEPERPERDGPCWLLKQSQMGTQRVQMTGALPWLVCSPRTYTRLLSCLGCSGQTGTKYFFPLRTLFQFICPHRPATWRAVVVQGHLSFNVCVHYWNWEAVKGCTTAIRCWGTA